MLEVLIIESQEFLIAQEDFLFSYNRYLDYDP